MAKILSLRKKENNMFTSKEIHYDTQPQSITSSNTSSVASTYAPTVHYGNNYILDIEVRSNCVATDLDDLIDWRLGVGNLSTLQNPLVESVDADFNVPGDWSETDPTIGKISARMNTTSTTLNTDLGTTAGKRYYCEISGTSNVSGDIITVAVFPMNIRNTVFKDV